jgi:hypothetical protein
MTQGPGLGTKIVTLRTNCCNHRGLQQSKQPRLPTFLESCNPCFIVDALQYLDIVIGLRDSQSLGHYPRKDTRTTPPDAHHARSCVSDERGDGGDDDAARLALQRTHQHEQQHTPAA